MPRLPLTVVLSRILLTPYVLGLGLIVWLPAKEASRVTGIVMVIARRLHEYGIPLRPAYTVMEFLANVALFVPFGILVALAWPMLRMWLIVVGGLVASATIELVQMTMPSRFPTLSDVVANTLGTAIGCGVVLTLRQRSRASATLCTRGSSWSQQSLISRKDG